MMPYERSLVKRLENHPFALLGVNSNADPDEAAEMGRQAQFPWRSFRNHRDGDQRPITEQWNVDTWPTFYLIDAVGIIRAKWFSSPGEKAMDLAIDKLVRQAEEEAGRK